MRWLHVASMAIAFGGAALLTAFAWDTIAAPQRHRPLLALAGRYEWLFWGAVGLLAMTGVGNVAAFGAALPAPSTSWGGVLTVKLAVVLAVATFSVPRTVAVSLLSAADAVPERVLETLRASYLLTALALACVLALAMWLAHQ